MNSNKLLIVSPSLSMGGIARHLSVIAESINQKGYEVHFLPCLTHNIFYELNDSINLIKPTFFNKGGYHNKLLFYLRLVFFLRRQIKLIKPHKVLVFGELFNPIAILSSFGLDTKVYIADMTSPDYKFSFPIPFLRKTLYPFSDGLIMQTKFAQDCREKEFNGKIKTKVIQNPVRDVKIEAVPKEKIILYVGRFAWEKGPDRLIKAFARIKDLKGWKLYMAGDGPLLDEMKSLARELNVNEDINFLGKVTDVDQLYSKASIYVLPSVLEGFPNALCEAMAAGLPVIAFNPFPSDEIITHEKDGLIVEDGNLDELAHQIKRLMDDEAKRKELGENAIKIRERLSPEKISDQVLNFMFQK